MKPVKYRILLTAGLAMLLAACSHGVRRVDYPATANPMEIVRQIETDVDTGYSDQYDVLAEKEFKWAQRSLADAKRQMADNRSHERVLKTLGYARAYLDRAKERAGSRQTRVEGLLTARAQALKAGAREYPVTKSTLGDADDELRRLVKSDTIKPARFSMLQQKYYDLELAAIQSHHLDRARAEIDGAKRRHAKRYAPRMLNRAELAVRNAENVIAANRTAPDQFRESVDQANRWADLLVAVLGETRDGQVAEDVALTLVQQKRQISSLGEQLSSAEQQSEAQTEALSAQSQQLQQAMSRRRLEQIVQRARQELSREEADVYQEGDKVLIRLKAMHFPVGHADLPPESIQLLAKVRDITENLSPKNVVIEGHTDSTGGERVNTALSQKRAEAVADYLRSAGLEADKIQAVGYGFKKPVSSNKSKTGRAQNRRVDVVITPDLESQSSTQ